MVQQRNQIDKDRFEKLKTTQIKRGQNKAEAVENAAEEVKELRRREGRSKDPDPKAASSRKRTKK